MKRRLISAWRFMAISELQRMPQQVRFFDWQKRLNLFHSSLRIAIKMFLPFHDYEFYKTLSLQQQFRSFSLKTIEPKNEHQPRKTHP